MSVGVNDLMVVRIRKKKEVWLIFIEYVGDLMALEDSARSFNHSALVQNQR